MEAYCVTSVNNPGQYKRWTFSEFCGVHEIQNDFEGQNRNSNVIANNVRCSWHPLK